MAEGKRLEGEPAAEVVLPGLDDQQQVLVAHAVLSLAVDARFVGEDHSRLQGYGVEVLPHILWPFVHAQEPAHAVAGAVAEVAFAAPEGLAGQGVQAAAGRPFREHGHRQVNVSLEHEGVVLALQRAAAPQGHRAGDVGGAAVELPAGVAQVESAVADGRGIGMRGDVVGQGGAGAEGGDGLEAVAAVAGQVRAQLSQLDGGVPLADLASGVHRAFQPVQETLHRQAVPQVRLAHTGNLPGVFDRLARADRAGALFEGDARADQRAVELVVEGGGVHEQASAELGGQVVDIPVGEHPHAVGLQNAEGRPGLGILDLLLEHVPADILLRNQQITDYQGVVFYVGGADVECPGDFVQSGEQDSLAVRLPEELPDPGDLFAAALARVHREDGGLRHGGTVRPEAPQQIRHADDGAGQRLREVGAHAQPVHGDDGVRAELPLQPFGNQHLLGHARLVQDDAGAFELLHGLDEVTRVGPQAGVVQGHDDVAGLAGEAGQPFHLFPSFGGVFAAVGVGAGDDHGVPALGAHQGAQQFDSFGHISVIPGLTRNLSLQRYYYFCIV